MVGVRFLQSWVKCLGRVYSSLCNGKENVNNLVIMYIHIYIKYIYNQNLMQLYLKRHILWILYSCLATFIDCQTWNFCATLQIGCAKDNYGLWPQFTVVFFNHYNYHFSLKDFNKEVPYWTVSVQHMILKIWKLCKM